MSIIVYDSETTGLLAPGAAGLEYQPYLVEFFAIKLDNDMQQIEELWFRCKPPIAIPADATKVHHITDADVAECKPFAFYLPAIVKFFLGNIVSVGHNVMFDKMVLYYELLRLGKSLNFPWAIEDICTAEASAQQWGFRHNLTDLHTKLFNESFSDAHSASADCSITAKCFVAMVQAGMIVL